MCPYYRRENLNDELKEKLGTDTWTSCDIDKVGMDAADKIERDQKEIAELRENVPQWFSVEDRLPEPGVPVLVNYIGTDELPYADGVVAWTDWGALWWEGSLADSEDEVTVPITHWMPLPEPPKEDV